MVDSIGNPCNLEADLKMLIGRHVTLFPESGGYAYWQQQAQDLAEKGYFIHVSDWLEKKMKQQNLVDCFKG